MSKTYYAFKGPVSGELLTYNGAVLYHDNPREMEFLIPNMPIVELPKHGTGDGRKVLPLRQHPSFASVRWPLRREDFNDQR